MQQHGIKYFACRPHPSPHQPDLRIGSKQQNSTSSEHGHVRESRMQQHCSQYVPDDPTSTPPHTHTLGMRSIGHNSTFSEHGYGAHQIKGNHKMQQHGSIYFDHRTSSPHYRGRCSQGGSRLPCKFDADLW